jgi:hypothetical protein
MITTHKACAVTFGFVMAWQVGVASAQQTEPTDAEKALAAQINCDDYRYASDNCWHTGPNARPASNSVICGQRAIAIGGAELVTVLNQKCKGH